MDFSFTEEQQMLQDSVQKFVHRNYDFESRKGFMAAAKGFSEENWGLFAELGWLTVPFKEEDGGFGGSAVDLMVLMEEFGKGLVVEPFVPTAVLGGGLIAALGAAQQKAELLPKIMSGELQLACAFAEPGSRYNLANVATTASKAGKQIVLHGKKINVLNGGHADLILVVARESGEQISQQGIGIFLVAAEAAKVSRQSYRNVDGQGAANISFDGITVGPESRLGSSETVYAALAQCIDRATLAIASEAIGVMDCLLRKTVEYSKTRKQFGVPIGSFQALQHRMADMFIECQLARSIVMMAAMKLDSSADADAKARAVSAAKSRVGKALRNVGQEAVQIHGGIGITDELDVAHYFKRATAIEVQFGNSDFHISRFLSL